MKGIPLTSLLLLPLRPWHFPNGTAGWSGAGLLRASRKGCPSGRPHPRRNRRRCLACGPFWCSLFRSLPSRLNSRHFFSWFGLSSYCITKTWVAPAGHFLLVHVQGCYTYTYIYFSLSYAEGAKSCRIALLFFMVVVFLFPLPFHLPLPLGRKRKKAPRG